MTITYAVKEYTGLDFYAKPLKIVAGLIVAGLLFVWFAYRFFSAPPATPSSTSASAPISSPPPTNEKLTFKDVKVGTGSVVRVGQTVSVLYTGKLKDGTVFDSTSLHGGKPIDFPIGVGQVIKGWDLGIVGSPGIPPMKVGGERQLTIPGYLAYGQNPPSGSPIGPNATLYFDVTVVSAK
jgi:peptidylprolyl isomerase